MKRRARHIVAILAVGGVVTLVLLLLIRPNRHADPHVTAQRVTERAEPLIAAIERFAAAHQRPPQSLDELVPQYLPMLPSTGLEEAPQYEYTVYEPTERKRTLVWYDLGSRNGAAMTGLWVYLEGDPDHAILAFELDANDVVVKARTDRMPANPGDLPFDSTQWMGDSSNRIAMMRSLDELVTFRGSRRADLVKSIGEPDGDVIVFDTPWALSVTFEWEWLDLGRLFYWPTQTYPMDHWGHVTPVGAWIYEHF